MRYKRSWKDASQCEVDFYINSTIDISKELEKEGHNVSSVEVRKVIEKNYPELEVLIGMTMQRGQKKLCRY